jgi:hypothetical protein
MGMRTSIILFNDQASEWQNDPFLGKKIMREASLGRRNPNNDDMHYGRVIHCEHADTQTLGYFDSYAFHPISNGFWNHGQTQDEVKLKLLQSAARELGYKLVKE